MRDNQTGFKSRTRTSTLAVDFSALFTVKTSQGAALYRRIKTWAEQIHIAAHTFNYPAHMNLKIRRVDSLRMNNVVNMADYLIVISMGIGVNFVLIASVIRMFLFVIAFG